MKVRETRDSLGGEVRLYDAAARRRALMAVDDSGAILYAQDAADHGFRELRPGLGVYRTERWTLLIVRGDEAGGGNES